VIAISIDPQPLHLNRDNPYLILGTSSSMRVIFEVKNIHFSLQATSYLALGHLDLAVAAMNAFSGIALNDEFFQK
jgi:hypothetical protein